jgi:chromosome partitioning protein
MRRIAIVNQKGGVGKTTTAANLGAALARRGRRVLLIDLDPQANLTLHFGVTPDTERPSTYSLLCGEDALADVVVETATPGLLLAPANIDLSGAELELASRMGRETVLGDALDEWERTGGRADLVLFDCPPSLGLLSVNGLVAAREVFIAMQTEFFALQGMSKLVEIVRLIQRKMNPSLEITGIVPCLYDSRLVLAREVLAEIRRFFPGRVFRRTISVNVKLAEAPSYGQTIFEYAPDSTGARDHQALADEILAAEAGAQSDGAAPPDGTGAEPTAAEPTVAEPTVELRPAAAPTPGRSGTAG